MVSVGADSRVAELASDFEFSRPERPAFDVCPCVNLGHLGSHFWFPLLFLRVFRCFSLLFQLPSLLDHDLLCMPLPHDCLPVLDDHFPLPDERESWPHQHLWDRAPVSLGLESRILKPNFASTYLTTSIRASSNVRKRFELKIRCFSGSSGTNDSRPASLISSSNFVLHLFLVARHVGLPASDHRYEFQKRALSKRDIIVRRRFRFLPPVVGSYRFCSLRHASNGFFRELATLSFAS